MSGRVLALAASCCGCLVTIWLFSRQSIPGGVYPDALPGLQSDLSLSRNLEYAGNWDKLAQALDACTVLVPAGEFVRGDQSGRWDERPQEIVYLDAYEIDRFEVTNAQYQRFLHAKGIQPPRYWNGANFPAGQAAFPVVGISWEEASAYCMWAGKRLPTEAEWEKACRGTDGRTYPWGKTWRVERSNIDRLAGSYGYAQNTNSQTDPYETAWGYLEAPAWAFRLRGLLPVGSFLSGASPYGVLDLAGNASEWVADWYVFQDYISLPLRNPQATGPEWNHALRGSSWYEPGGSLKWAQQQSRCAARNSSHVPRLSRVGFRCARSLGLNGG
jgi:sulfatase modifying factor 1